VSHPRLVIPFVKASACGNDFLLVDSSELPDLAVVADITDITRRMCDRHEGVGADGVEWMSADAAADVAIRLVNADGSEAEISGNGTRCVAAHICAQRGQERIVVLTGAGLKTCVLTSRHGSDYEFETEMGAAEVGKEFAMNIGTGPVKGIPVSMGNPHFVVFASQFADDWREQAAAVQRSPHFTQGVNVEMVVADGKHDVKALFFERGAGETRSSGTGSCAAAVASISARVAESPVRVHAPGGTQTVRLEENEVFLRGTARLVCRGEFYL
jgi:diaminopimelate epimerase